MANSPPLDGPTLRRIRREANLSQAAFARIAGISLATYNNAERGVRAPTMLVARRLRKAIDEIRNTPGMDRVSALEIEVSALRKQVQELADSQTGAVA